ncbi:hypothetical protein F5Y18DRAFT_424211 [Xylariaceae sp. FL1019]|nr:hypothetical protein F5Y18DRAFT_424211 [Xylariaceae sp. FL1019]
MQSTRFLLAFVLSVHPLVATSQSAFGEENFGYPQSGPWNLNYTVFAQLLSQPNATGDYPLLAPDVAQPPSTNPPDLVGGWNWNIRVRADMPVNASGSPDGEDYEGEYYVGSAITLQAPEDIEVDEGWDVCIISWRLGNGLSDKLRTDDGTCSSIWSDKCRRGIRDAVADRWTSGLRPRCLCPDFHAISGCGEEAQAALSGDSCESRTSNSTQINNSTSLGGNNPLSLLEWSNRQFLYTTYGGVPSNQGNISAYNTTASLAWPFMVVWGVDAEEAPASQLTCVRAANATIGSQIPGPNYTSMGVGISPERGSVFAGVMLAVLLSSIWAIVV